MKYDTDEICGTCGSTVVACDECGQTFCPSERPVKGHEQCDDEGD